jgi:ERCC4-related helicase
MATITGNVIVFGLDLPVLEFLLILNVIMLVYVIISMLEIRSLIKMRKDLEDMIQKSKTSKRKEEIFQPKAFHNEVEEVKYPKPNKGTEEVYSKENL